MVAEAAVLVPSPPLPFFPDSLLAGLHSPSIVRKYSPKVRKVFLTTFFEELHGHPSRIVLLVLCIPYFKESFLHDKLFVPD